MKALKVDKSGNAMLIVALGVPSLVGGAGFAIDTAQWYMWKRELQHSVDQAAYAGAWALAHDRNSTTYLTRAQQEYAANLKVTTDFASSARVVKANYAGGTNNSVLVTASASQSLPFSSFIMGRATSVSVSAQASFASGFEYTACLVSTATTGTGTTIGGNATVRAQCGLAALSCDPDVPAIEIDGSANVETSIIAACGGIEANNYDDEEAEEHVAENIGEGVLEDIYAELDPPTDDRPRTANCTGSGRYKQMTLEPGTYSTISIHCTTVLKKGIYVVDGGTLDLTGNYDVNGQGVMFVLRNGAQLKLGGSGNGNKLNLTPPTEADLVGLVGPEQAKKLEGILVFEERDNEPAQPGHIFNGNSHSLVEGLIYLPSGELTINGTANVTSQCLQITAKRLRINGNATIETLCPTDQTTVVGSGVPKVRLVA
ncbi:TadE/TadG family type IV pilus assembly protein [Qipengyuania atrilutea]|uniref:TadE/TadG family type IV pilus assembly protein n=1 Tax=Qipengyuania atrilutea TaxID=2744473 RepID=UPI001C3DBF53|nr:pilus assembly protein TadG-related protein [Actirhodobacter atriluteus]